MYEKIKELCKEKHISVNALEQELGFAKGSLCKIDKNKPSSEKLQKLADYFGVQLEYLTGASEFKTKKEMLQHFDDVFNVPELQADLFRLEKGTKIPVLGTVVAGIPIEAVEEILDWEEISVKLARTGEFFGLKIQGDSMSPRILEGDVVIVKQQPDADSGDIVIAKVNGDDACCKKLIKNKDGITLQSLNPNYAPIYFSREDILERPVTIIGKVVELRGKFA